MRKCDDDHRNPYREVAVFIYLALWLDLGSIPSLCTLRVHPYTLCHTP